MAKLVGTSDTNLAMPWTPGKGNKPDTPAPDFRVSRDKLYDTNNAQVKVAAKLHPWAFEKMSVER